MSNKTQGSGVSVPDVNLGALATQASSADDRAALELELLRAQVLENRAKQEARALQEERQKKIRLETIRAYQKEEALVAQARALCSHKNELGRTHIAGQYAHNGSLLLICQGCGKTFSTPEEIKIVGLAGLMPAQEFIGGPNRTAA